MVGSDDSFPFEEVPFFGYSIHSFIFLGGTFLDESVLRLAKGWLEHGRRMRTLQSFLAKRASERKLLLR